MKRSVKILCIAALGFVIVMAGGCASYYKIKDPASGTTYYTQEIDKLEGGAVKIKDQRSGSDVTIQNSEVNKITKDEYTQALKTPAPVKPEPTKPTIIIQRQQSTPAPAPQAPEPVQLQTAPAN